MKGKRFALVLNTLSKSGASFANVGCSFPSVKAVFAVLAIKSFLGCFDFLFLFLIIIAFSLIFQYFGCVSISGAKPDRLSWLAFSNMAVSATLASEIIVNLHQTVYSLAQILNIIGTG